MRSLTAPFRLDGGSISSTNNLSDIIKQKIINCLVISKMERTGLPFYGAGAASLLFDNVDSLTERDFTTDAIQELRRSVSDASILDMNMSSEDDTTLTINVMYKTQLSGPQVLTFTLSETDFLTEESPI